MKTSSDQRQELQRKPRSPPSRWTSNLKDEAEIEEFKRLLQASKNSAVLRRLLEIVQEEQKNSAEAALKGSNYDSPSWAYGQADSIGYQRALKNVERLLQGIFKL
jgi:predicted Abi (CAAX) family protease